MVNSLEHNMAEKDRIMSQLQFLDESKSGAKAAMNRLKGYGGPNKATVGASPQSRGAPIKLGGLIDN